LNERDLLRKIEKGAPSEKDSAAEEICNRQLKGALSGVIRLLQKDDPLIRTNAVIILGVLESKKKLLEKIVRSDSNRDVRVAAEVMIENFGKITYEEAKNRINAAKLGKDIQEEKTEKKEKDEKSVEKKRKSAEKDRKRIAYKILLPALVLILVIVLAYKFYPQYNAVKPLSRKTFTDELKGRIEDILDFKKDFISNNGEPKTIKIKTYSGDTYGRLLERIYDVPEISVSGKNTIYAFFRKYNFKGSNKEKQADLLEIETSDEELIFPNVPAMHLAFDLTEGSVAYQYIVKSNDSLEISLTVDKIVIE